MKRARGTYRAGVPLRPDRKGEEATSTKKKQVHKAGESAFMIESGSFCTVEGVKASAFGFFLLNSRASEQRPARRRGRNLPGNGAEIMKTP